MPIVKHDSGVGTREIANLIHVGDWVRFYRAGTLVIAVVEYKRNQFPKDPSVVLITNCGEVDPWDVIESRSASVGGPPLESEGANG